MNRHMPSCTIGTFGRGLTNSLLNSGEKMAALSGMFGRVEAGEKLGYQLRSLSRLSKIGVISIRTWQEQQLKT